MTMDDLWGYTSFYEKWVSSLCWHSCKVFKGSALNKWYKYVIFRVQSNFKRILWKLRILYLMITKNFIFKDAMKMIKSLLRNQS